MTSRIRAAFFDLGGTLFDNIQIPKLHMPLLREAARRLEVDDALGFIGPHYVNATREANERFKDLDFYMHSDLFYETFRVFADKVGGEATDEFVEWLYVAQRDRMITGLHLREGCKETLQALRSRGLNLSIVSNIDDDFLDPMLDDLELKPLFDHWSSSEEARACKPNPKFFEYALEKAGFAPEEVVFVGDSRLHDVAGAREVGLTAVLIEEEHGRSPLDVGDAEPHHTIETLPELIDVIEAAENAGR
jgi:HAD superfamily hydrolase (TIGR01549 family)